MDKPPKNADWATRMAWASMMHAEYMKKADAFHDLECAVQLGDKKVYIMPMAGSAGDFCGEIFMYNYSTNLNSDGYSVALFYVKEKSNNHKNNNMKKAILLTVIIGLGIASVIIGLVHLLGNAMYWRISPIDSNIIAVHPSIARTAFLNAGIGTWLLVVFGGLVTGFGIASGIEELTLVDNFKGDTTAKIALCAAGVLIILTSYLSPAYRLQDFIHKTVTREEAKGITNKDFTSTSTKDPNIEVYNKYFANQ